MREFDDRIHDLRKYGFSFITALLTAESFLIPGYLNVSADKILPDFVKLAVLGVTLLLIVALRLIERNYQLFIKCAAQRSRIIERSINFELSEIITQRHQAENIKKYELRIYYAFTLGVFALGVATLYTNILVLVGLVFFTCLSLYVLWLIKGFELEAKSKSKDEFKDKSGFKSRGKSKDKKKEMVGHKWADWTLDPLKCEQGEKVRITLTNLDQDPYTLKGVVWEVKTQDDKLIYKEEIFGEITVAPDDNYIWLWGTSDVEPGVYKVIPYKWNKSLYRKIIVTKRKKIKKVDMDKKLK